MISTLINYIAFTGLIGFGTPQSTLKQAKEDFSKMNKVLQAEKVSVEMAYYFFEEYNGSPVESQAGVFYRNGKTDYSKINNIETLHTPELTVVAHHDEKLLTVSGPVSERLGLSVGPDTLLRLCKEIKMNDLPGNKRRYELIFNDHSEIEFKKIEILLDVSTYQLSRFTLYFRDQDKMLEDGKTAKIHPKVEILYKNYNTAVPALPASGNYIEKISDNKYRATGKYSSFKIYNQKLK